MQNSPRSEAPLLLTSALLCCPKCFTLEIKLLHHLMPVAEVIGDLRCTAAHRGYASNMLCVMGCIDSRGPSHQQEALDFAVTFKRVAVDWLERESEFIFGLLHLMFVWSKTQRIWVILVLFEEELLFLLLLCSAEDLAGNTAQHLH